MMWCDWRWLKSIEAQFLRRKPQFLYVQTLHRSQREIIIWLKSLHWLLELYQCSRKQQQPNSFNGCYDNFFMITPGKWGEVQVHKLTIISIPFFLPWKLLGDRLWDLRRFGMMVVSGPQASEIDFQIISEIDNWRDKQFHFSFSQCVERNFIFLFIVFWASRDGFWANVIVSWHSGSGLKNRSKFRLPSSLGKACWGSGLVNHVGDWINWSYKFWICFKLV